MGEREEVGTLYIFSFNALTPRAPAVLLYTSALLRETTFSSSPSLVIEPRSLARSRAPTTAMGNAGGATIYRRPLATP